MQRMPPSRVPGTLVERLVIAAFWVVVLGGIVVAIVAGTLTSAPTATTTASFPPCDPHRLHLKVESWDSEFPGTSGQRVIALHITRLAAPTCRITSPIELELREPGHGTASLIRGNPMRCSVHRHIEARGVLVIWSLIGNVAPGGRLRITAHWMAKPPRALPRDPADTAIPDTGPGASSRSAPPDSAAGTRPQTGA
jgi:hypothetical protein